MFLGVIFTYSQEEKKQEETKPKEQEIENVVIKKDRKAVEQKADRTIFDIQGQPNLNSGNVMEAIKQLPGVLSSDIAGMMYQGKMLDVYLNNRPLNIGSNELTSFLEGMPANSIDRIEIVTQPGAEFPATSGGAILNIITNKNASKYLTATLNTNSSVSNYDKSRLKSTNSILLNGRNTIFAWQLNIGQNYRENFTKQIITKFGNVFLSNTLTDRINRNYFARSGLTFDFKKDRLLLNYDLTTSNNNSTTNGFGEGFVSNEIGNSTFDRNEGTITYQKRFDERDQKLDFVVNLNKINNYYLLFSDVLKQNVLNNSSVQSYVNAKVDYVQPLKIFDEGKVSTGLWYDKLGFDAKSFGQNNLDYQRSTYAGYLEFQAKYGKFDMILGTRAENYDITGKVGNSDLIPFKQFRFFPNATVQYNLSKDIFFNLNYNKKITLPSTASLNPNNTVYQNQNVSTTGNPNLQPTIFNNFEAKLSAFDYAYIGYNISTASNQVVQRAVLTNNQVSTISENLSDVKVHNFNFAIPLPYMLFTKGLKETMKFDFNPDKINFLYMYTGYTLHQIPNINTKGFWNISLMSQLLLPWDVKFITEFVHVTKGGNFYYFQINQPFNQFVDLTFSKKFLKERMTVSLYFDDIFNQLESGLLPVDTPLFSYSKNDSRKIGFSINYKLPTKNKLAKEEPRLQEKKEDNTN